MPSDHFRLLVCYLRNQGKDMSESFAEDGRVQLHWQNPRNCHDTVFVAECAGIDSLEALRRWVIGELSHREQEIPCGWVPMICDSSSAHFKKGGG